MAKGNNISSLLNEDAMLSIDDGSIEVFDVPTEQINTDSQSAAEHLMGVIADIYGNENLLNEHPKFKMRLDNEIDTLRRNLKMCKTDELLFDKLSEAVGQNPNNAALWIAFARHQKTIMDIQVKIDQSVDRISKLVTSFQTELTFKEEDKQAEVKNSAPDGSMTTRGGKAFLEQINQYVDTNTGEILDEEEAVEAEDIIDEIIAVQ